VRQLLSTSWLRRSWQSKWALATRVRAPLRKNPNISVNEAQLISCSRYGFVRWSSAVLLAAAQQNVAGGEESAVHVAR